MVNYTNQLNSWLSLTSKIHHDRKKQKHQLPVDFPQQFYEFGGCITKPTTKSFQGLWKTAQPGGGSNSSGVLDDPIDPQ
jgi:hypothetical protein